MDWDAEQVSVVLPAYNATGTLADTISSARSQTYRNLEIIIVDDGSTDGTHILAENEARQDSRIRVLRQSNQGVAAARNAGIALATSRFIAPLDADDLWHPTKTEKQMAVMAASPAPLGFVYSPYRSIDLRGAVTSSAPPYGCEHYAFARHLLVNFVGNGSGALFRRSAILEAGGYASFLRQENAEGCEDMMLQVKICRRHPIGLVPEYLVGYRSVPGNMSSHTVTMLRSQQIVIRKLLEEERSFPRWPFEYRLAQGLVHLGLERLKQLDVIDFFRFLRAARAASCTDAVAGALWAKAKRVVEHGRGRLIQAAEGPREQFADCDPREPGFTAPWSVIISLLQRAERLDHDYGVRDSPDDFTLRSSPPGLRSVRRHVLE